MWRLWLFNDEARRGFLRGQFASRAVRSYQAHSTHTYLWSSCIIFLGATHAANSSHNSPVTRIMIFVSIFLVCVRALVSYHPHVLCKISMTSCETQSLAGARSRRFACHRFFGRSVQRFSADQGEPVGFDCMYKWKTNYNPTL